MRDSIHRIEADLRWIVKRLHVVGRDGPSRLSHEEREEREIAAWLESQKDSEVTTAQVLEEALRVEEPTRAAEMRVAECMRRLGWTKSRRRDAQGIRYYFWREAEPAS